jgi:signal transduction histidine kinase
MDASRRLRDLGVDQRVVDAVLVAACLALTVLAVKAAWAAVPRPAIAVAGVVGSLAQWPRRRWPAVAAVAGSGAYALSGNPGPLLVGLYSGASHSRPRWIWAYAVVGAAGFAAWSGLDEGRLGADDVLFSSIGAAFVAAVGMFTAARRASWRERIERAEAERLLRDEQARAAERDRIAREMHDVLAHKVSLIALHAGALELRATADPAQVHEGAALIRATAREALQELRDVLGMLRLAPPAADEPFPSLAALVRESTEAGQRVELHDDADPLPPATARVVYRIAQEGLTNARKHAPGALATVSVSRDAEGVKVVVRNPTGAGPPLDLPGAGSGLVGLAERVRLAGGTLHTGPDGHGGWRLRAVLPTAGPVAKGGGDTR